MTMVNIKCPNCGKLNLKPYKRRGRRFCGKACAYSYRTIYPKDKICEQCGKQFSKKGKAKFCSRACAAIKYTGFKHSEESKKAMKDAWTPLKRALVSVPQVPRKCPQCKKVFLVKERGKESVKKFCSEVCYRFRLKRSNHMKRPDMRERMSEIALNRSQETNRKIAASVSKAWKDGRFAGVRVGQCNWYHYRAENGTVYKVQGAWELAFCDWMCSKGLKFTCHRGWIPYRSGERKRYWYPDFRVIDWKCWIDVKADHFYDPDKFRDIKKSNPGIKIRILRRADLEQLGVLLYVKGSRYHPHLQDLIRRSSIQPRAGDQGPEQRRLVLD